MKIKSIYKSLLALPLAAVSLSSCSDWLEIDPQNVITIDEFWNEKSDVDGMIAGLYSNLQSENAVERMMIWGEFRSDNISTGVNTTNNTSLENILRENIVATNAYTTWNQFYYIINQANTIIDQAPAVAEADPAFSQSELQADIAECSAIRDLCYFYLIRTFRDVPYSTTPYYDDDQEMSLPATSFDNILDSLITDLENVKDYAVTTYPASSSTKQLYQTGRITKCAIWAMLCEMYLWKQDYQNCIKYADLVIDYKKQKWEEEQSRQTMGGSTDLSRFNGYPLVSDYYRSGSGNSFGNAYSDIFGYSNNSTETGGSSEIIFELQFMSAENMPKNSAVNVMYGPTSSGAAGYVGPSSWVNEYVSSRSTTTSLYYQRDARFYENIASSGRIGKYEYTTCTINTQQTPYTTTRIGNFTNGRVHSNWIIYRLTDIMLLKAEALTELMSGTSPLSEQDQQYCDQAFSLVNAVNKRSICQSDAQLNDTLQASSYASKEAMENLVLDERQRELMFEGKRYYDLVRRSRRDGNTDVISTNVLHKYSTEGATVQNKFRKMDYIYWPYNNDELKVNKSLTQNPAFGSGESSSMERN